MVRDEEYIMVEANILHRLNPLAPYILRLVLSTIETTSILFFVHKLRQARHLTEERVKECKENDCTHPFLSANEVVLLLLIATELPTFISSIVCLIVCLFNNGQDNLILLDLIVLEVSFVTHAVYELTN